jgi:hypothetical protein
MRFTFLDEGGISQYEPRVVVAGVFVDGDKQLIRLEQALDAIVRKHIPEKDWDGFVLHAKDIWGGGKYFNDRDRWPIEKRAKILDDLVAIPSRLEIPVIFNWVDRADIATRHNAEGLMPQRDFDVSCHAVAFAGCMLKIEEFMRRVWVNEIAQVVAEDNPEARSTIKGVVELFKQPTRMLRPLIGHSDVLPLERIRGSVQFASKSESRPLQLADACAFLIRRRLYKHDNNSARFYNKLKPWMLVLPREDSVPEDQPSSPQSLWPFGPLDLA